ncbi:MAG: hypothetical protein ACOC2W_01075 [bacterium]
MIKDLEGTWKMNIKQRKNINGEFNIEQGNGYIGVFDPDKEEPLCECKVNKLEYIKNEDDFSKVKYILIFPGKYIKTKVELLKKT